MTAQFANLNTSAVFSLTNIQTYSLVVNSTQDLPRLIAGQNSLRAAINYADTLTGPQTITFDPTVFGTTPQTIILAGGPLTLTNAATTTIDGPGAAMLTVSGDDASRVFDVEKGSAALSGLTVSGGMADNGGGLYNNGGTLSLTDCTVSGNSASADGGGLLSSSDSTLSLIDCTVSDNTAGVNGGGLYSQALGRFALTNCTVCGNTAGVNGGGLFIGGSTIDADPNCTVSGNTAGATGGGLYVFDTPTLTNTLIAGNTGGDIHGAAGVRQRAQPGRRRVEDDRDH